MSNLDLSGRAVLHCFHHAPVRHLSGPLRGHSQPHRAQPLQLQNQSHDEDRSCLDHFDRWEGLIFDVFMYDGGFIASMKGNFRRINLIWAKWKMHNLPFPLAIASMCVFVAGQAVQAFIFVHANLPLPTRFNRR